jgi:hypothetical protein
MLIAVEIGMLVYGLYAFAVGRFSLGQGRIVIGNSARLLGMLLWLPLPLAFAAGAVLGLLAMVLTGSTPPVLLMTGVEVILVIGVAVAAQLLGRAALQRQSGRSL